MKIYMDHAATTPVDEEVVKVMQQYFSENFGNPSSLYSTGQEANKDLEKSRGKIAKLLNAEEREIIFTSGGTESDNLAIKGTVSKEKNHIITSNIEHPAVLETCKALEKEGCKVTYIPVNKEGIVDPKEIEKAITEKTAIVSIMHANNEIGTIQPIEDIGKICREKGVLFHTDAVQTFGKIPIDVKKMNIDLLSASSHKLYGPKGVGLLYIRKGIRVKPLINGGEQEFGFRSGTENIAGIVGFAKAFELANIRMEEEEKKLRNLRDKLIIEISKIKGARLNGSKEKRLYSNVNFCFSDVEGEALIMMLDNKGIAVSTGSACSTKSLQPSHVLTALGLKPEEAHGSLRITLGKDNDEKQVDYLIKILPGIIENLRRMNPLYEEKEDKNY